MCTFSCRKFASGEVYSLWDRFLDKSMLTSKPALGGNGLLPPLFPFPSITDFSPQKRKLCVRDLRKQDPGSTVQKSVIPEHQQYRFVLVDTWWYRVSMEWYWLVLGGTGSVEGGTG